MIEELIANMKQNEVIFNRVASESIQIFASYDSTYSTDMIHLLTEDVCNLVRRNVPEELVHKCETELSLKLMDRGLVIGMNFFQRIVLDAIYADTKHELLREDFLKVEFANIDFSIFFMFKIYQATQARIFISLTQTLEANSTVDYVLFSLQIFVFVVIIGSVKSLCQK